MRTNICTNSRELLIEKYINPSDSKFERDGLVERWRNKLGKLHGVSYQPAIIRYYKDGQVFSKFWFKNGVAHRDGNKPSDIWYKENGKIECKKWYKNGECVKEKYY